MTLEDAWNTWDYRYSYYVGGKVIRSMSPSVTSIDYYWINGTTLYHASTEVTMSEKESYSGR